MSDQICEVCGGEVSVATSPVLCGSCGTVVMPGEAFDQEQPWEPPTAFDPEEPWEPPAAFDQAAVDVAPAPPARKMVTGNQQAREMTLAEALGWCGNELLVAGCGLISAIACAGAVFLSVLDRPAAIFALIQAVGLLFLGAVRYLNRSGVVPRIERPVLAGFHLLAAAIAIPAGLLFVQHPAAGIPALALLYGTLFFTRFKLVRDKSCPLPLPLLNVGFIVTPLFIVIPFLHAVPGVVTLLAGVAMVIYGQKLAIRFAASRIDQERYLWGTLLLLAWMLAATTAAVTASGATGWTAAAPWGVALTALAFFVIRVVPMVEHRLKRARPQRVPLPVIAATLAGLGVLVALADPVSLTLTVLATAWYLFNALGGSKIPLRSALRNIRLPELPRLRSAVSEQPPSPQEPARTPSPARVRSSAPSPAPDRSSASSPAPDHSSASSPFKRGWTQGGQGAVEILGSGLGAFAVYRIVVAFLGSDSNWAALALAATAWISLAITWSLHHLVPSVNSRRGPVPTRSAEAVCLWLAFSVPLMTPALFQGLFPWQHAAACAVALVTLTAAAVASRRSWPFFVAGLFAVASALWCVDWLGLEITGLAGTAALAFTTALLVIGQIGWVLASNPRSPEQASRPVLLLCGTLAFIAVARLLLLRTTHGFTPGPAQDAWLQLGAVGILIASALAAIRWLGAGATSLLVDSAALASVLVPVVVLDRLGAPAGYYGVATVGLALLVALAPRGIGVGSTAALLATGFWFTITKGGQGPYGDWLLLASLAVYLILSRFALTPRRALRSCYIIAGSFTLFWFGVARTLLNLEVDWMPALALAWAALAIILTRARWSGIELKGGVVSTFPLAAAALVFFGACSLATHLPGSFGFDLTWLEGRAMTHAAAAFAIFGLALGVRLRPVGYLFSLAAVGLSAPILAPEFNLLSFTGLY